MGFIEIKVRLKMSDKMEVYYFSPTGGTKKVSSIFADAMEKEVIWHDLGSKEPMMEKMRKKSINLQNLSRIALLQRMFMFQAIVHTNQR